MGVNLDFEYSTGDKGIDIIVDATRMNVTKPEQNSILIRYYKEEREINKLSLSESNENAVEFLATYVVAEAFKLIMERNRAHQRDKMLDIYGFFSTDKCRELEKAVISLPSSS